MFGGSRTKDEIFYAAFRNHAQATVDAASAFRALLDDPSNAEGAGRAITESARRGKTIAREVLRALHDTWITPFDRQHIHRLVGGIDAVIDRIDSTAARVVCFGLRDSRPDAAALAREVHTACGHVRAATELLPSLGKSAAAGPEMLTLVDALHEMEVRVDEVHRRGLQALFAGGSTGEAATGGAATGGALDSLLILKWNEVFDRLERAADLTRDLGKIFEAIVLENA